MASPPSRRPCRGAILPSPARGRPGRQPDYSPGPGRGAVRVGAAPVAPAPTASARRPASGPRGRRARGPAPAARAVARARVAAWRSMAQRPASRSMAQRAARCSMAPGCARRQHPRRGSAGRPARYLPTPAGDFRWWSRESRGGLAAVARPVPDPRPGAGPVSRAAGSGAAVRAGGSSCSPGAARAGAGPPGWGYAAPRSSSISLVVAGIAGGPGGGGPAGLAARPGAGPVSRAAGSGAAGPGRREFLLARGSPGGRRAGGMGVRRIPFELDLRVGRCIPRRRQIRADRRPVDRKPRPGLEARPRARAQLPGFRRAKPRQVGLHHPAASRYQRRRHPLKARISASDQA